MRAFQGLIYALATADQRGVRLLFDTPAHTLAFVDAVRATGEFSDRPSFEGGEPNDCAPTGRLCSVCGCPQLLTPSGTTCRNGHGGSPAADGA